MRHPHQCAYFDGTAHGALPVHATFSGLSNSSCHVSMRQLKEQQLCSFAKHTYSTHTNKKQKTKYQYYLVSKLGVLRPGNWYGYIRVINTTW